jgi:hypothetical protein
MKAWHAGLVFLALVVGQSPGQDADPLGPDSELLEVVAPVSVAAGELIEIDATSSAATSVAFQGVSSDLSFRLANNNRTLFAATSRPGTYQFAVAGCLRDQLALKVVSVVVEGSGPEPAPLPPGPGPSPPEPTVPGGAFGLTKAVYDMAKPLASQYGALLREVGTNYSAIANTAAGVRSMSYIDMREEVKGRNRATAGANREALLPTLFQPLAQLCGDLERSDKPPSREQWIEAYQAIAEGFALGSRSTP